MGDAEGRHPNPFRLPFFIGGIVKTYKVPTGHICTMEGEKGRQLEFLSIGDYGKEKNLKADFLGLTNEIDGVPHGELLPLSEKWVITISSQYGCSMGCRFCDVPKVGKGDNATYTDMVDQVMLALSLHTEIKECKRINLHYARMGEPTINGEVIDSAYSLHDFFYDRGWGFHPVVSTMMPDTNVNLKTFIARWLAYKNWASGDAGLQISINTTDQQIRRGMMPNSMSIHDIASTMEWAMKHTANKGRKIALNFALTDAPINAKWLRDWFDPEKFLCKITPMHETKACVDRGILTDGGYDHYYPYKKVEDDLKAVGFDVIVFIPSKEEDASRITCGNAILADMPKE